MKGAKLQGQGAWAEHEMVHIMVARMQGIGAHCHPPPQLNVFHPSVMDVLWALVECVYVA